MRAPANTKPVKCPICHEAAEPNYLPFCSKRCADVDLGRWLTGGYVVPGRENDEEEQHDFSAEPTAEDRPMSPGGPTQSRDDDSDA